MNLKALRTARGLTQVELAKKMKRQQAYIAQLESGTENNPTLDTLRRLAKALKVTVAELVGFAQWFVDNAGPAACTIDGKPVKGLDVLATSPYRVGAQVFSYTLAHQNNLLANYLGPLFGVDLSCIADGTTVSPAAEDGVYLMLAPLSAGQHTIHFTVQGGLDITYELTVLK